MSCIKHHSITTILKDSILKSFARFFTVVWPPKLIGWAIGECSEKAQWESCSPQEPYRDNPGRSEQSDMCNIFLKLRKDMLYMCRSCYRSCGRTGLKDYGIPDCL